MLLIIVILVNNNVNTNAKNSIQIYKNNIVSNNSLKMKKF